MQGAFSARVCESLACPLFFVIQKICRIFVLVIVTGLADVVSLELRDELFSAAVTDRWCLRTSVFVTVDAVDGYSLALITH